MATSITDLVVDFLVTLNVNTKKAQDLGTSKNLLQMSKLIQLTFGATALKGNQIFHNRDVLDADEVVSLDLAGGLTNVFGDTITFAKVRALLVINTSDVIDLTHTAASLSVISVGGNANAFDGPFSDSTDIINIAAGNFFAATRNDLTGWPVTGATGDILDITETSTLEGMYDIVIIGEEA